MFIKCLHKIKIFPCKNLIKCNKYLIKYVPVLDRT